MALLTGAFFLRRLVSAAVGLIVFHHVLLYMTFLSLFYKESVKMKGQVELKPVPSVPWWVQIRGTFTSIVAWASDGMVYLSGCLTATATNPIIDMFQYSYPAPFTQLWVPVGNDVELFCQVAHQGDPGKMTVILVPGMFNSSSFSLIVSIACLIYSKWNANVIVVDLRGHGQTGRRFEDVPFSLTVLEARDLLLVANFAKNTCNTESIFLLGVSLGGTCVLSAAVEGSNCSDLITAAATISAPMDLDSLLVSMSQAELNIWFMFYTWILHRYCSSRNIGWHSRNFYSFVHNVVKPYYCKEFAHALESTDQKISPMLRLKGLQIPLLAVHSADDPVATLEEPLHLKRLAEAHNKQHLVKIQLNETGGHAGNFSAIHDAIHHFFLKAANQRVKT